MRFDRLAAHQIRKAEAEDRLKNLNGARAGRPSALREEVRRRFH